MLKICSLVLPFKKADLISDWADLTFSSTENFKPAAANSFSNPLKYGRNSKSEFGAISEKSKSSENLSSP